jgi:hypothetical protein
MYCGLGLGVTSENQACAAKWEELLDAAKRLPMFQWSDGAAILRSEHTTADEKRAVNDAVDTLCIDICKKGRESWGGLVGENQEVGTWFDPTLPFPERGC